MPLKNKQYELNNMHNHSDVGIIFVSSIIGLPVSILSTFDTLKKYGIDIKGVDNWEAQNMERKLWNILRLTIFPGSHKRRVEFTNNYNEYRLFEVILDKIDDMIAQGKKKIILGGMSSGFIFVSRIAQISLNDNLALRAQKIKPFIKGLFGISPLVFYPPDVLQKGADLKSIPSSIPTVLIWGDADTEIPKETIAYSQKISKNHANIKTLVIRGSDVNSKDKSVKHQFFGGRNFIKPLKNIFWNPKAETLAISHIHNLIESINSKITLNNHE